MAYVPTSHTAVFGVDASDHSSTVVAQQLGEARMDTLLRLNVDPAEIIGSRTLKISYRSVDGDTLDGMVVLPVDYQPRRRYPLVVNVYGGDVIDANEPVDTVGQAHDLFAGHGYAVLAPSIPLKQFGVASDPYLDIPKGVLPAIDRVVELGIADPDRIGIMGHSYGGYTVYALLSASQRFKAAIARDAPTDLISVYGAAGATDRYSANGQSPLTGGGYHDEAGQFRMGRPPWDDIDHYVRNSPIAYAHRITTPLMIMQGDMDFVPIEQGEEMFSALSRLGRRVVLVRYLGEGHVNLFPANVRDENERMLAWFDTYLACGAPPPARACAAGVAHGQ